MRRKKDRSNGITALYERLSRDDDNAGESNSIVHQKQMLEDYAIKHGFTNLVHFTDDGWSGATFDRPSWNRLVEGVKNGEITACICKDMSRIGRDPVSYTHLDVYKRQKCRKPCMTKFDGTPCAVKAARTVWSRGKVGDHIKDLPMAIRRQISGHEAVHG